MSEHDPMFDSIPRYTMLVKVDYMGAGTGIAAEPNPDGGWINAADLPALIARVREDERSNNFTPDDHSDAMTESYHRGFDDARWIAAKEALQGVQHEEPCDCEPCQAITRALAELRTIGQD